MRAVTCELYVEVLYVYVYIYICGVIHIYMQ